jgi:segregation and condensation protein A
MSKRIWDLEKKGHEIFVKPKVDRKAIVNSILTPMDLNSLTLTMVDFLFRQRRKYTVVKRDRLSIKEKLKFLKENLKIGEQTTFDTLLEQNGKAEEGSDPTDNIVITFISLLELARLKRINVFQNEDRSTIYVNVVRSLEDFDVEQANGFEDETPSAPPTGGVEDESLAGVAAAAAADEKLVLEDLGDFEEVETPEVNMSENLSDNLSEEEYIEKYGELLTTPESVDEGAKLIQ